MQISLNVPDEVASKLADVKPGDSVGIEFVVGNASSAGITGDATDVLESEGADAEAKEPADESAESSDMPPMVQDKMA